MYAKITIIWLGVGNCQGTLLIEQQTWPTRYIRRCFSIAESFSMRSILHRLSVFHKTGSLPAAYSRIQAIIEVCPILTNSLSYCLNLLLLLLPINRVFKTVHIERPSSFSIKLYDSQSYLRVPATSYSPDIFFILLRAKDSRFRNFNGGILTILSMQFEEMDSFSTRVRVLRTEVSSLSIGGFCIRETITKKINLIYSASEAGLP